jgi:hypothetical protein
MSMIDYWRVAERRPNDFSVVSGLLCDAIRCRRAWGAGRDV